MNWVDRKFAKEQNLANAIDVWNKALAAVHDAVKSFTTNGEHGKAEVLPQNGHRILVQVEQPQPETAAVYIAMTDPIRRVQIAFAASDAPAITVTVDSGATRTFPIEADETHCFLKFSGVEISPDEFSEHALNEAFFTPKPVPPPRRMPGHPRPHTAWS